MVVKQWQREQRLSIKKQTLKSIIILRVRSFFLEKSNAGVVGEHPLEPLGSAHTHRALLLVTTRHKLATAVANFEVGFVQNRLKRGTATSIIAYKYFLTRGL